MTLFHTFYSAHVDSFRLLISLHLLLYSYFSLSFSRYFLFQFPHIYIFLFPSSSAPHFHTPIFFCSSSLLQSYFISLTSTSPFLYPPFLFLFVLFCFCYHYFLFSFISTFFFSSTLFHFSFFFSISFYFFLFNFFTIFFFFFLLQWQTGWYHFSTLSPPLPLLLPTLHLLHHTPTLSLILSLYLRTHTRTPGLWGPLLL